MVLNKHPISVSIVWLLILKNIGIIQLKIEQCIFKTEDRFD